MLDVLIKNLIETFADVIAGTAVAVVEDQQARREKIATYREAALTHSKTALSQVVDVMTVEVRNRFVEWFDHPRLGHESLSAELHAADLGLNEAIVDAKKSTKPLKLVLLTAACIRLAAITQIVGPECIYTGSIKSKQPAKPVSRRTRKDGDQRMNRRKPKVGDVPVEMHPTVAALASSNPDRARALDEIKAQRGGPNDHDGILTKLAALAMLEKHAAFIDDLAVSVAETLETSVQVPIASDLQATIPVNTGGDNLDSDVVPAPHADQARGDMSDDASHPDIALVAGWCAGKKWAVRMHNGRFTLKPLAKRSDINAAFDRVANHPAMQEALRAVHEAGGSGAS